MACSDVRVPSSFTVLRHDHSSSNRSTSSVTCVSPRSRFSSFARQEICLIPSSVMRVRRALKLRNSPHNATCRSEVSSQLVSAKLSTSSFGALSALSAVWLNRQFRRLRPRNDSIPEMISMSPWLITQFGMESSSMVRICASDCKAMLASSGGEGNVTPNTVPVRSNHQNARGESTMSVSTFTTGSIIPSGVGSRYVISTSDDTSRSLRSTATFCKGRRTAARRIDNTKKASPRTVNHRSL